MEKMASVGSKLMSLLTHPITKVVAKAGAIGIAGGTGYKYGQKSGYKSGAKKATNEMAIAFSEANAKENQRITDSFKTFNKAENRAIAQSYYRRGLAKGVGLKEVNVKTASVYDSAFSDELEKLGFAGIAKTIGKSFKNLASGTKEAYGNVKSMAKTKGTERTHYKEQLVRGIKKTGKKSKSALAVTGGAAAYAAG